MGAINWKLITPSNINVNCTLVGSALFYLQDIPLHVCMISHLLIAWDRLRWLSDPLKFRVPAFVCSCASWLAGIVITLPYPIYIIYMDLGVSIELLPSIFEL